MSIKKNFLKSSPASRQRGQGMSEYIIVVALIAVASIGVFAAFGTTIKQQVAALSSEIAGASSVDNVQASKNAATNAATKAGQDTKMGNYGLDN